MRVQLEKRYSCSKEQNIFGFPWITLNEQHIMACTSTKCTGMQDSSWASCPQIKEEEEDIRKTVCHAVLSYLHGASWNEGETWLSATLIFNLWGHGQRKGNSKDLIGIRKTGIYIKITISEKTKCSTFLSKNAAIWNQQFYSLLSSFS
jgi:hypothetical protein